MSSPNAPPVYHLVALREGEDLTYQAFDGREELLAAVRALKPGQKSSRVRVFIFRGDRLKTTAPPWPYLLETGLPPLPLFDPPTPGDAADDGLLALGHDDRLPEDYEELTRRAEAEARGLTRETDNSDDGPLSPDDS